MTLPASGAISLGDVNTELGYSATAQISLNDAAVRALAGIPSGPISMNDLYGKSATHNIPAGLIIMSANGSVPSGWTRFSAADDRFIAGAGNSYSPGSTGGSSTVSAANNSSTAGAHDTHADITAYSSNIHGSDLVEQLNSAGDHYHLVGITSYTPKKSSIVLIKANADYDNAPAQGMFFAPSTLSGFSVFSGAGFLFGGSSNAEIASSDDMHCESAGDHTHTGSTPKVATGSSQSSTGTGISAHTHTLTKGITDQFKQAVYRALYKASAFIPDAGLIAMWEGTTAPSGWHLCDGAAGTVDLRDYFILLSVTGTGSKSGTNQVTITVSLNVNSWTHNHQSGLSRGTGSLTLANGDKTASHSHTSSVFYLTNYTPVYYALTFIQKV